MGDWVDKTKEIELAISFLEKNEYKPFEIAYYVRQDDSDGGGEDHCINCIKDAVKVQRKFHFAQREEIKKEFEELISTGVWRGVKQKEIPPQNKLRQEMRRRLKKYPAKAKFTYEGHDPDFGGGLTEPKQCPDCGEHFDVEYKISADELKHVEQWESFNDLEDRDKYILYRTLNYYDYQPEDMRKRLDALAAIIIKVNNLVEQANELK